MPPLEALKKEMKKKNSKKNHLNRDVAPWTQRFMLITKRSLFKIAGNILPGFTTHLLIKWFKKTLNSPLRKKGKEFLQTANQILIKFKDVELAGYSFGKGPLILVVHGSGGNATNFRCIVPKLVENGFKVIAFDWPNHGNSPCRYNELQDWEELVPEVIQQTGQVYGIITHSGGAPMTARALINCPKTTELKKCIFISPHPGGNELLTMFLDSLSVPQKVCQRFFRSIERQMNTPREDTYLYDCLSQYQEPNIPAVLTIHDKNDEQIPFNLIESLFEKNYDSELYATEGLGHYKILRDKNVIRKTVDFLNG